MYDTETVDKASVSWYKKIDFPVNGKTMESGKRKYSRCDFSEIIAYSLLPQIDDTFSTGLLHNFSYSGLCIITHAPVQPGQEICVKSSLTSNSVTAVVRWCSHTGNATYKVGIEFRS